MKKTFYNPSGIYPFAFVVESKEYTIPPGGKIEIEIKDKKRGK